MQIGLKQVDFNTVYRPISSGWLRRLAIGGLIFLFCLLGAELYTHRIASSPSALLDMTTEDVKQALGYPQFLRDEPPAQHWQYRAENCVLDVFLYSSDYRRTILSDQAPRVVHYQIRARDQDAVQVTPQTCMKELIARR